MIRFFQNQVTCVFNWAECVCYECQARDKLGGVHTFNGSINNEKDVSMGGLTEYKYAYIRSILKYIV